MNMHMDVSSQLTGLRYMYNRCTRTCMNLVAHSCTCTECTMLQHVLAHVLQPQLRTRNGGQMAPHRMEAVFVDFDTYLRVISSLFGLRQPIRICTRLGRKTQRTHMTRLWSNLATKLTLYTAHVYGRFPTGTDLDEYTRT